jgi:predicted protein tyrosine phosphatase
MNILFVCSRNQWRSPTAEQVWRGLPGVKVRSAGTSAQARRKVSRADIQWADYIFVMETKHQRHLRADFRELLAEKRLEVLEIPDQYRYLDPELVEIFSDLAAQFQIECLPDHDTIS